MSSSDIGARILLLNDEHDMTLRWLVAAVHLLALVIGSGAICVRAWSLRTTLTEDRLRTVFLADGLWGLAAFLWIGTGIWRAFGGLEKGTAYYMGSAAFWIKMALLTAILVLEVRPMITLIRWRGAVRRGQLSGFDDAVLLSRISMAQLVLVGAMVFAATAMARGLLQ
jgi:putative membrane protein